jgi:hypothetical protein
MNNVLDLTNEDQEEEEEEKEKKERWIAAVDPGPKNCGIAIYDLTTKKAIRIRSKRFLDDDESDLGNARLIEEVRTFILRDKHLSSDNLVCVFVENQTVSAPGGDAFTNAKNVAIQYCFQSVFGKRRCVPVAPGSVKAHFREHFPVLENASRKQQYRQNKRSAVVLGRKLVGPFLAITVKGKTDDPFDAAIIGAYAIAKYHFDEETNEVTKLQRKKKKKVAAVPKPTKRRH